MDDLTQQLQNILADPQAMNQIQGMLRSLGGEQSQPKAPEPAGPDLSALAGLMGGGQNGNQSANMGLNTQTLAMVGKLAPGRTMPPGCCGRCAPCWGKPVKKRWTKPSRSCRCCGFCPYSRKTGSFPGCCPACCEGG